MEETNPPSTETPKASDTDSKDSEALKKPRRGFASMTPERRRELASLGGKRAHATGRGHQFTTEEAKAAGAKGGRAAQTKKNLQRLKDLSGG